MVFRRRLPPGFGRGKILVSPDAGLRFYRRNLAAGDEILFKMVDELVKPGDVVWDVGANVGLFTFASANRSGKDGEVIAIEADLWLVGLLRRSCEMLERSRNAAVMVIPAAASDSLGLATFHIAERTRSSNHLEGVGSTQAGGTRRTESIVTITLDWLYQRLSAPQVLKIDVEGAEMGVFRELVASNKLRQIEQIFVEYHHHIDKDVDELGQFLRLLEESGFGYVVTTWLKLPTWRRRYQDLVIYAYRK